MSRLRSASYTNGTRKSAQGDICSAGPTLLAWYTVGWESKLGAPDAGLGRVKPVRHQPRRFTRGRRIGWRLRNITAFSQ